MTNLYSFQFLIFFLALLICYYGPLKKYQWQILLVFSLAFYALSGLSGLIFILGIAAAAFLGARKLEKLADGRKDALKQPGLDTAEKKEIKAVWGRKRLRLFWLIIVCIFLVLAYFKYVNPHIDGLLVPLGLSFYIFIAAGYVIDIYYEKYETEKNFFKFLLFLSYFPQLIQGPINRYDKINGDLYRQKKWDHDRAKRSAYLILFGLMKKYAIANMLVELIGLTLDDLTAETPGSMIVLAILMYSIQQYADFSGGIDLVMGLSGLLGIEMMPNFRQPYFATSLANFWQRWHISLGAWMRDYVFYPFALTKPMKELGKWAKKNMGKHWGRVLPAAVANILVFLLVGIWHGSEMHYIYWGLYNGLIIALSSILEPVYEKLKTAFRIDDSKKEWKVFCIIRTFLIVNIGWYFDRIYTAHESFMALKNTICNFGLGLMPSLFADQLESVGKKTIIIMLPALLLLIVDSVRREAGKPGIEGFESRKTALNWALCYFMIIMTLISFSIVQNLGGFIYANF